MLQSALLVAAQAAFAATSASCGVPSLVCRQSCAAVWRRQSHAVCVEGGQPDDVAAYAATMASQMRKKIEDAEEDLLCEVVHSSKFVLRGDGLREDFARSGSARRRRLLRATADNEQALLQAMQDAELAGLPRTYMEDAIRVANMLALARAEIESDYLRSEQDAPPPER